MLRGADSSSRSAVIVLFLLGCDLWTAAAKTLQENSDAKEQFVTEDFASMDPAVRLVRLRQGTRSLKDHIQDFLVKMPAEPERLHVMPAEPELLHVSPAEPELLHVMPAEPELLHVKAAVPESAPDDTALIIMAMAILCVSAAHTSTPSCDPSAKMAAAVPESRPKMAAAVPESRPKMAAAVPESRPKMAAAAPESSLIANSMPVSSDKMADSTPLSSDEMEASTPVSLDKMAACVFGQDGRLYTCVYAGIFRQDGRLCPGSVGSALAP
ncbi:hypothetical protein PO909_009459 [Leuciscus waleckii]